MNADTVRGDTAGFDWAGNILVACPQCPRWVCRSGMVTRSSAEGKCERGDTAGFDYAGGILGACPQCPRWVLSGETAVHHFIDVGEDLGDGAIEVGGDFLADVDR